MRRRKFLELGILWLSGFSLSSCTAPSLPDGVVPIRWDRDKCDHCGMMISDYRFAAQARGGPKDETLRFDDIGCAVLALARRPWGEDPATRVWVADIASRQDAVSWLDARRARYLPGRSSPMGYDLGATTEPRAGGVDYEEMRRRVAAMERRR
jgi:nitrous oxide reductase accessory protein NosL